MLAEFENIIPQVLERCRKEGRLYPTLITIKDGAARTRYLSNTADHKGMALVNEIIHREQPDAFISFSEVWIRPVGDPCGAYGEFRHGSDEGIVFLVRSKDGGVKKNRTYKIVRDLDGVISGFVLIPDSDQYAIPLWNEFPDQEAEQRPWCPCFDLAKICAHVDPESNFLFAVPKAKYDSVKPGDEIQRREIRCDRCGNSIYVIATTDSLVRRLVAQRDDTLSKGPPEIKNGLDTGRQRLVNMETGKHVFMKVTTEKTGKLIVQPELRFPCDYFALMFMDVRNSSMTYLGGISSKELFTPHRKVILEYGPVYVAEQSELLDCFGVGEQHIGDVIPLKTSVQPCGARKQ